MKAFMLVKQETEELTMAVHERGTATLEWSMPSSFLFIASGLLGVQGGLASGLAFGIPALAYGAHAMEMRDTHASHLVCAPLDDIHQSSGMAYL